MNVSSTSTCPAALWKLPVRAAHRIRCAMNQAVFWVTPSARCNSIELTPVRRVKRSQTAGSHLSRPSGESSKMVPTLTENCFLQALHFHRNRVDRYECCLPPHLGQTGPSGQRRSARYFTQVAGSEKNRMASTIVFGSNSVAGSPIKFQSTTRRSVSQVYKRPYMRCYSSPAIFSPDGALHRAAFSTSSPDKLWRPPLRSDPVLVPYYNPPYCLLRIPMLSSAKL